MLTFYMQLFIVEIIGSLFLYGFVFVRPCSPVKWLNEQCGFETFSGHEAVKHLRRMAAMRERLERG